jgi:sarcosine oxidase, subunit alpha
VQGRVTSTYYSPDPQARHRDGASRTAPTRMGEIVEFNTADGGAVKARVCDTIFFDKDGEKQNV